MAKKKNNTSEEKFEKFAVAISKFTGNTSAFIIALSLVIVWGISGPIFHYSEPWQLVINTLTTIITFLMVFLIQRAQNKDSLSIQLKLNELIAAVPGASNRLVDVEDITEKELALLKKYYQKLSSLMESDNDFKQSHSIEEAVSRHEKKNQLKKT